MHQGMLRIVIVKALEYLLTGNGNSMTHVSSGQRFSQNQYVRQNQVSCKAVSGTAKACCHLIKN